MLKTIRIMGSLAVMGAFLVFAGPSFAQADMETQPDVTEQAAPNAEQLHNNMKAKREKHVAVKKERRAARKAKHEEIKHKRKAHREEMKTMHQQKMQENSAPLENTSPEAQQ